MVGSTGAGDTQVVADFNTKDIKRTKGQVFAASSEEGLEFIEAYSIRPAHTPGVGARP